MLRLGIWLYSRILTKIICKFFVDLKINIDETISYKKGSIYVFNHNSSSDAFILGLLPCMDAIMVIRAWPLKIPIIGYFAKKAGYFCIDGKVSLKTIDEAKKLIKNDISIMVFPEGTRAGINSMNKFHSLAFRLAKETNADIVPVIISGNRKVPLKGSLMIRPAKIELTVLKPLNYKYYEDINAFVLKNKVRNIIANVLNVKEKSVSYILEKSEIKDIMQHKPPLLLIDTLVKTEERRIITKTTFLPDSPFINENGNVDECVYPELFAQSLALHNQYKTKDDKTQKPIIGFVVNFRSVKIYHNAKIYDNLEIIVEQKSEFENLVMVTGKVKLNNLLIADGEIRVWIN